MSASATRLKVSVVQDEIAVDYGQQYPLVPDALYEATLIRHNTSLVFGRTPTVFLWFRLVSPGEYFGKEIFRAYRAKKLVGHASKTGGQFTLSPHSQLFQDICAIANYRMKPSRVSLAVLRNRVLQIRTRTVKKGWNQKDLPDWFRYSVVDQILRTTTGT